MSDYHDYSVYASCGSSLVKPSAGNPYFLTHPALRNADSDFVNLKYAYVKIAYQCDEFIDGSDRSSGWGLTENFAPNAPKVKPSAIGPEPNHYMFHDIACQSFRTTWPGGGPTDFSGKLFANGQNVAGCNLVFTTEPTHELNGKSYSTWETLDGQGCPNATADKGNIGKVTIYTSPVICISGQLMRYPTVTSLYRQYLGSGGARDDQKSLAELKLMADNNAWRLRRAIYDILCPCHQCKDIGKGTFIAVNNCIPCVCRKGTTETCHQTVDWQSTYIEGGQTLVDNVTTTTCPTADPYSIAAKKPNCIKCRPTPIVHTITKNGHTFKSTSTFCKDGSFCKEARTTRYRSQCGYASKLLPVMKGDCIKVKDVKAIVGEVNSIIQEAQQFSKAYLVYPPSGMITYVAKDDKDWTRAMKLQAKGLTNLVVPSVPYKTIVTKKVIELKTISTTCPPLVWVTTSTTVKKVIQWKPVIVRPRTVTYSYQTRKDICKISPKDPDKNLELLCLCNENECLDQEAMFSVIAKLAVHIEKLTKSMCIPWRLAVRKDRPSTTTDIGQWTFNPVRETVVPGDGMTTAYDRASVACSSHRCLTSFPMKCNCIRKPVAPDSTYGDNEIFKCQHTATTRTRTAITTYVRRQYTIYGHVYLSDGTTGVDGVAITLEPTGAVAVTGDGVWEQGYYEFTGLNNDEFELTPELSGYSFKVMPGDTDPPATVTISGDSKKQDFKATQGVWHIRGHVYEKDSDPVVYVSGVVVTATGSGTAYSSPVTGEDGAYDISGVPDGVYDVSAAGGAYTWAGTWIDEPEVAVSGADQDSKDFEGTPDTPDTYTLSGIVYKGDGITKFVSGAVVSCGGQDSAPTGTDGVYIVRNIPMGTYEADASKDGWTFTRRWGPPTSLGFPPNWSDKHFSGTQGTYTIYGHVVNHTAFNLTFQVAAVGPDTGSTGLVLLPSGETKIYSISDLSSGLYTVTCTIDIPAVIVYPSDYVVTLDEDTHWLSFYLNYVPPELQTPIIVASTSLYPAHVYDGDACSIAYPCTDGIYADASAMDKVYMHPVWLYRGWQMMGQTSLSDYIKRFFGYSWSMVPGCCHGTDCLGQWHFEMLWRVTQALLRGSFDQFQGVVGKTDVIYKLAHCGPPDCGVGPFFKEYQALFYDEPDAEGSEQTITQLMAPPTVSDNSTVPSPRPKAIAMSMPQSRTQTWKDFNVVGHIAIEDSKYWMASGTFGGKNHSYMRTYVAINIRDGRESFGSPEQLDGLTVLVDRQNWDTPEVELHMALLKALKCRYHMHGTDEWGKDSLSGLLRLVEMNSGAPGFKFWFNTLIVSLVVDGIISAEQFGELATQLPGGLVNPRSNVLAIDYESLRIKMERAVQDFNEPVSIPDVPDVPDLAKELSGYVDSAVQNASITLDPDTLYEYAGRIVHAFDRHDEFVLLYEESMDSSSAGCTSCRLTRLKKEMYAAFCYAVTKYPDAKRLAILNAWSMNLPEAFLIRMMDNFRFKDIRRWELIPKKYMDTKKIVVSVHMAVGDMISVTNAVAELKRLHPEYRVWVDGACMELWENNPNIERGPVPEDAVWISLGAGMQGIPECHFIDVYPYSLFQQLGLKPDFQLHKGDLHLSELEKSPDYVYNKFGVQSGKYWLIVAGYKMDLPLKHWGPPDSVANYQELVRMTRDKVQWIQVGKTDAGDHHKHFRLEGALDLLGHTNNSLRDLFALVYHAQGVVCPNTCAVHIAMAFAVPCVSIGGGKESKAWCEYAKWGRPHKYITTIGKLGCCDGTSCSMGPDKCKSMAPDGGSKCMSMITPAMVAEEVLSLAGAN